MSAETHDRLLALLKQHGANYRLIDHPPQGHTEEVSALRGHPPSQAAKCIVLRVKVGKKHSRYVLAVVPGDRRVDINAIKTLLGGTYAGFADAQTAERLAASVAGTVLPFALDPDLELIVDPSVLAVPTLYFNAARLDRSIALASDDYQRIARPRVATIASSVDRPDPKRTPIAMPADDRYDIHLDDKFGHLALIDIEAESTAHEPWFNQTLTSVNDAVVRLGIVEGEFHWHHHDDTDEFFLVLEGQLFIDLEDRETVPLRPHQGFTVPRGVRHRTRATLRTSILMIEAASVVPTGD